MQMESGVRRFVVAGGDLCVVPEFPPTRNFLSLRGILAVITLNQILEHCWRSKTLLGSCLSVYNYIFTQYDTISAHGFDSAERF